MNFVGENQKFLSSVEKFELNHLVVELRMFRVNLLEYLLDEMKRIYSEYLNLNFVEWTVFFQFEVIISEALILIFGERIVLIHLEEMKFDV